MFKNLMISACLALSLSDVSHARVNQCIDEKGHRYFTDRGCPRPQRQALRLKSHRHGSGVSALIVNPPRNPKTLETYCNPGKGKFIRCE